MNLSRTSLNCGRRNSDTRLMNCSVRVPLFTFPPVVATSFACEGMTAAGWIKLTAKAASGGPVVKLSPMLMTTKFTPMFLRMESISWVQPVSPDKYTFEPGVPGTSYGVSRIIEDAYTRGIFKEKRPIQRTKITRTQANRCDLHILCLSNGRKRNKSNEEHYRLPFSFHLGFSLLIVDW